TDESKPGYDCDSRHRGSLKSCERGDRFAARQRKDARGTAAKATPHAWTPGIWDDGALMNFADRLHDEARRKHSVAMLGVDPKLDARDAPGIPPGYTITRFCCEVVEACAPSIIAVKPQLAFFEARGVEGMRALAEVIGTARRLGLITIADAKRGDIGSTSAAYAEAFLGDGDFGCDAVTINPYLGADAVMPFIARVSAGRGVF